MKKETKNELYPLVSACFENQVQSKMAAGKERTAGNYLSSWKKFSVFLDKNVQSFTMADLTPEVAQKFVTWLANTENSQLKKLSFGTQDFYLRNLKAMYKKAIKETGIIPPAGEPFAGLYIKVPSTRKRALPDQGIKKLVGMDLSGHPKLVSALHLALFLFYARGMCFIDVFHLRTGNLYDGYVHYIRSKTGVTLQVKITPEMQSIINLYHKKNNPWVFPFLHEKLQGKGIARPQSVLHRINDYLKEVGKIVSLPYPLTTYVMRHSWASMMLEADSGLGVISQSLGHTSLHTTEIYLGQLSVGKMDKAADKMLDNLVRPAKNKKNKASTGQTTGICEQSLSEGNKTIGNKWKNIVFSLISKIRL